jgi:putative N6-adenine-specific DNA methylase
MENFFAPCPRGLEAVLAQELAALEATGIRTADGGVHFEGPLALGYRANLESRIASRILWRVATAPYKSEDDIFKTTLALPWPQWFDVTRTIRVNLAAVRCPLKSLDFVTLRIKDAVCDAFRAQGGERPSVNTQTPDVRIHAFLTADQLTLYIDTSGEPLFKRGYVRQRYAVNRSGADRAQHGARRAAQFRVRKAEEFRFALVGQAAACRENQGVAARRRAANLRRRPLRR